MGATGAGAGTSFTPRPPASATSFFTCPSSAASSSAVNLADIIGSSAVCDNKGMSVCSVIRAKFPAFTATGPAPLAYFWSSGRVCLTRGRYATRSSPSRFQYPTNSSKFLPSIPGGRAAGTNDASPGLGIGGGGGSCLGSCASFSLATSILCAPLVM